MIKITEFYSKINELLPLANISIYHKTYPLILIGKRGHLYNESSVTIKFELMCNTISDIYTMFNKHLPDARIIEIDARIIEIDNNLTEILLIFNISFKDLQNTCL